MNKLLREFENPSADHRAIPFWSWNDSLVMGELVRQIREMKKAGLGGYFMHARGGLQTEYMGEDWMECIKACIEEGNEQGMGSWCYDENGWPSGFANGVVTALGDRCHVRWLEMERTEIPKKSEDILGVYETDSREKIIIRHKSNSCYVDILNSEVVSEFVKATHEVYYNKFKEHFGKGIKGFFTDEPQFARGKIPWSYVIPEEFEKRFGYDIVSVLPSLFIENEGYEKVRYNFWALVSELYTTSFGKQFFDWCEQHNCMLTGHAMEEDSLLSQMGATGGVMPFYEYLHIPGMDWLGRRISSPVIPKQVSSVSCQLGKKLAISETFALCGWDVSWEELKWIAQWQYVNGINLMCQHLEGYSLRGIRKRDYPPSLFYQQSWWEEYEYFNNYFARVGALLTKGRSAADVLLLHPMKSAWLAYDGNQNEKIKKLDDDFIYATKLLSGLHIEHHYGDETIMKQYASVNGKRLVVGECSYSIVVLPSLIGIDGYTAELLNEFSQAGGQIISLGEFPKYVNGEKSPELKFIKKVKVLDGNIEDVYVELCKLYEPRISISYNQREIDDIHVLERDCDVSRIIYAVNNSNEITYSTMVAVKGENTIRLYLPETNTFEEIEQFYEEGVTKVNLAFLPMQAHMLITEKGTTADKSKEKDIQTVRCGKSWDIEEMRYNSLTLDYCQYQIDGGVWQKSTPVIEIMDTLLSLRRECEIAMKFEFDIAMNMEDNKEFLAAIEAAEEFEISVNGNPVKYTQGWWKDISFKTIDIKGNLKDGRNEIVLKRRFYQREKVYEVLFGENILETETNKLTLDTELESIYLIGDFGVVSKSGYTKMERKALVTEGPFLITDKPITLNSGSFTEQGLCFYSERLTISQAIEIDLEQGKRVVLDLGRPSVALVKVLVNGLEIKTLPWTPYIANITDYVEQGMNTLTLQLYASNRNLLGPHHHVDGELYMVGPASFTKKPGWEEGNLQRNIWTDSYCFAQFGIYSDNKR